MAREVVVSAKRRVQEAELALRTAQMDVETLNTQQSGKLKISTSILVKSSQLMRLMRQPVSIFTLSLLGLISPFCDVVRVTMCQITRMFQRLKRLQRQLKMLGLQQRLT